jgi:uncharacterized repeat protein (TIGR03803 family)
MHNFSYADGIYPYGSLTLLGSTLYGMTTAGGANSYESDGGNGTIFQIDTATNAYSVLYSFGGPPSDGYDPWGDLTLSGTTLYGMTLDGGANYWGTIFKFNTANSVYTDLYSPTYANGTYLYGSLALSADGSTLYGMTDSGGANGDGAIFQMNTGGSGYTVLHSFSGSPNDGSNNEYFAGSLTLSADGSTLYGMTYGGGAYSHGTIFSLGMTGPSDSLSVTISPAAAVSAGAMWNVDGGAWQASGATVSNLSVGSHTVAFKPITGWITPASESVTIAKGGTAAATGAYVQQTGSLKVTITPSGAVTAGAKWSVNGGSTWNASSATVSLAVGSYTLTFKPVTGWTTPASKSVTITKGGTATATGAYVQQTGSLEVTIIPSGAVTAGAKWSVNGGGTWNASGATVSLAVGNYTLTFKTVTGWTTPASKSVTITNGGTATFSGVYVKK